MSQITPERGYSCDPYIPDAMPDGIEGDGGFAPTLAYRTSDFDRDLVDSRGQVVPGGEQGSQVLELGFTDSLDPMHRAEFALTGRLEKIASIHGTFRAMLEPVVNEDLAWLIGDDAQGKQFVQDKFRDGELPTVVVGHTSRAVAAVAIRDFGFKAAKEVASNNPAIQALGDNAATVYMLMDDFLNRKFRKD